MVFHRGHLSTTHVKRVQNTEERKCMCAQHMDLRAPYTSGQRADVPVGTISVVVSLNTYKTSCVQVHASEKI